MLNYDADAMPPLITGVAEIIARQAPAHMIPMVRDFGNRHPTLQARVEGTLLAFEGFVHRCEVALARMEGREADVDRAITRDGADLGVEVVIGVRDGMLRMIEGAIKFAEGQAKLCREILGVADGPYAHVDAAPELKDEITMSEEGAHRLRYAIEAFRS